MSIKRGFSDAELSQGKNKNIFTGTAVTAPWGVFSDVHDLSILNICF